MDQSRRDLREVTQLMFWQDDDNQDYCVPDDIQDVAFRVSGKRLPIDHMWALSEAIQTVLPWLKDEPEAGIHEIHVAASGNGWMRPEQGTDEWLYLSRRTRMNIRLPKGRLGDVQALTGRTLSIAGENLTVDDSTVKPLSDHTTIFSRYVAVEAGERDENDFLKRIAHQLRSDFGIKIRKMLCGKEVRFATPDGELVTRNIMLSDLEKPESVELQQRGLGPHRLMGCGLFIPHKGIDPVSSPAQDD